VLRRLEPHGLALLMVLAGLAYVAGGLAYVKVGEGDALFVNDGFQYYAYLPSLVLDGDLDFTNQYALGRARHWGGDNPPYTDTVPRTGRPSNAWALGPALLWLPFFLVGLGLDRVFGGGPLTGFSMWCQWPVYLGSGAYGLLGLWLLYRHVLADYPRTTRLLIVALVLVGTNLNYYLLFAGHMSHGLSFFAVTLHLVCLRQLRGDPRALWRWLAVGATVGVAALVRWQDVVVGLLPLAVGVQLARGLGRRWVLGCAVAALSAAPAIAIQAAAWQSVYGTPFTIPQGSGFMAWGNPHWAGVLLSDPKGLLFNSPLVVAGTIGLVQLRRRDAAWSFGSLLALAAAVYVCAASSQWDAGESFGMRRLVMTLPLVVVGLCELAGAVRRRPWRTLAWSLIYAGGLWNCALLATYFVQRLANP
jgi:hypothetical protein